MNIINKTKQAGFTLVELIIVIVILGILSAFAIPKFIDVSSDARVGAVEGTAGAIRSAASIVYAKSVIDGTQGAASSTVTMADGTSIATAYGYPTAASIATAIGGTPEGFTLASGAFSHDGATTAATCKVTYTAAADATTPPTVATVASDCS